MSWEARWFWWGMGWGVVTVLSGTGFYFLYWNAERLISSPWARGFAGRTRDDAYVDSLTAAVLGIPLTVVCCVAFLICWGRWFVEIRERRDDLPTSARR